jgi:hypothetical protein
LRKRRRARLFQAAASPGVLATRLSRSGVQAEQFAPDDISARFEPGLMRALLMFTKIASLESLNPRN